MSDRRGVSIPILLFLSHWSFESRHFSSFACVIFFHINFCCDQPQARLVASKFSRLFWGEQPPFTPIGRGGRYFFGRNRITINNRVYMEQTTPVTELVVLSRRIEVEHELLHTWVGSSKRVKLHDTFLVKAGFDLQQNLSIDIRPAEIIVQLPHAQILGIEEVQVDVLAFENGFWNRISGEDVQSELSILPQLAREKAAESGLATEAEGAMQRQLDERIHAPQPLHLVFKNEKKSE